MIHLEKAGHRNVLDIIELEPFESQYSFAASNVESIVEAYIAVTSADACAYPFGVYHDDTLVGFLMIDKNHQGKGNGREAVRLLRICGKRGDGRGRDRGRAEAVTRIRRFRHIGSFPADETPERVRALKKRGAAFRGRTGEHLIREELTA